MIGVALACLRTQVRIHQTFLKRYRMKKSIGISPNIETFFGTRDENVRLLEDGLNITINLALERH